MSKTHYSDIAVILSDLAFYGSNKDSWKPLLDKHDLAFALADLLRFEFVDPTPKGWQMLDECWDAACDFLGVDPYNNFDNANDMLINFDGGYFD